MSKHKYQCSTSFLDMLFNMLLAFVALFVISFALIQEEQKETADNEVLGNLIITMTWPSERNDDIDLWVRDPNGKVVFFRNRQAGLLYLDRDDVGVVGDYIETDDGRQQSIGNQEIVTVRGIIPGEYVINVHAYYIREWKKGPIPVTVRVDKIGNPTTTIASRNVIVSNSGDEKTAFRLSFGKDKTLESISRLKCGLFNEETGRTPPE